jgi:chromosome segregation ATPase
MDPRLNHLPQGEAAFLSDLSERVDQLLSAINTMNEAFKLVVAVVQGLQGKEAEYLSKIASIQEELALAKAENVADDESIDIAKKAAAAARAEADDFKAQAESLLATAAELQAKVAAGEAETAQIVEFLTPLLPSNGGGEPGDGGGEVATETPDGATAPAE